MNRLLTLAFVLAAFTFTSCEQDNRIGGCTDPFAINFNPNVQVSDDDGTCAYVPEERMALLFDITATWCGPCGSWGAPLFDEAVLANTNKMVPMALHASDSDPMYVGIAKEIAENYPDFTGYPTIVVNNLSDFSSEPGITSMVNSFVSETPVVSAIQTVEVNGDNLSVTAQSYFFEEVSGIYKMAIYVMEDKLDFDQNGMSDPDYLHNHVLRASADGTAFGEEILDGDSWVGMTSTKNYTIPIDPSWNLDNIYTINVIWEDNGSSHSFVNAFQADGSH